MCNPNVVFNVSTKEELNLHFLKRPQETVN